jgi:hypothetical protein
MPPPLSGLRTLSGLELGGPYLHAEATACVLAAGQFDQVLGCLHALPDGSGLAQPPDLYTRRSAAEVTCLVSQSDAFSVVAYIDYPIPVRARAGVRPLSALSYFTENRRGVCGAPPRPEDFRRPRYLEPSESYFESAESYLQFAKSIRRGVVSRAAISAGCARIDRD